MPRFRALAPLAVAGTVLTGLLALPGQAAAAAPRAAATLPPYSTWVADVTAVAGQASAYLRDRLPGSGRPAIVLDIDNTSLESNYHPSPAEVPAVAPVLQVAQYAAQHGATVFFVTGRLKIEDWITRYNLTKVGYQYAGVYETDLGDLFNLQKYKTAARADIEAKGYTIVANIGNNDSDLAGGHAERTFKLPDYGGLLP
jgi:predicted secreted acid phosphatase